MAEFEGLSQTAPREIRIEECQGDVLAATVADIACRDAGVGLQRRRVEMIGQAQFADTDADMASTQGAAWTWTSRWRNRRP